VAYTADIVIAVKGATQITNLQQRIQSLSAGVNSLNATLRSGTVASIDNFNKLVSQSDRVMRSAAQGTRVQKEAIDTYVRSVVAAEKAEKSLQAAIGRRRKELGLGSGTPAAPSRGGGRLGGAISGSIIGGAFPLLFGQGGGAAAGGAIGGLVGGLAGPGGSFAGSLLGTLLGDIASKGNTVKTLAEDIGFSATQTKLLETAFKQAGAEFDKFESSVQNIRGLGLDIESQAKAIRLVSTLTAEYGGEIDKVTNALTSALESGKVTQATLNQLTSQGIPIQQALADKYKVSRSELLQMAKDGKIAVQDLIDELVVAGNKGVEAADKPKSSFDRLKDSLDNLGKSVASLGNSLVSSLGPAFNWLTDRVTDFVNAVSRAISRVADLMAGGRMTQATLQAETAAQQVTNKKFGLLGGIRAFNPAAEKFYQQQKQTNLKKLVPGAFPSAQPSTPLQSFRAPAQLPPSGGGGGGRSRKAAEDDGAEKAQRLDALLKQLREEIRIRTEGLELEQGLVQARADQNDELQAQIQSSTRLLDIGSKQAVVQRNFDAGKIERAEYTLRLQLLELDRTEDQIKYEEDLNRIFKERYGITDAIARLARETRTAAFGGTGATGTFRTDLNLMPGLTDGILGEEYDTVKLQLDELLKVENQVISAADSIGQAFGNSFKGVIDGSMSAREALAGFFSSVADSFADMAAQMISQWIKMQVIGLAQSLLPGASTIFPQGVGNFSGAFGSASSVSFNPGVAFGGFRASGGSVNSGSSYMVGERGPELFVPGRSGTIIPNDKMGSGAGMSVVVNVDASGSNVEGDAEDSKQLGRVIAAAIQQELVKQKRPGGLLA
jgi:tape measure domain-containing protein